MIKIYLIDSEGLYIDTVLYNIEDNTYYSGNEWEELNLNYVEDVPPLGKVVKWTGQEWNVIEPLPSTPPLPPTQQDLLNATLLKQSAEFLQEINTQKALNAKLLMDIAKLSGGV